MNLNNTVFAQMLWMLVVAVFCSGCGTMSQAATSSIVLKEQINQKWTNELVSYPFSAGEGEVVADSIAVNGPAGAVPAQLADVELWPGTQFVKSARVLFLMPELAPLSTHNYTIASGKSAAGKAASDLKVSAGDGFTEVSTSRLGARLLTGEKIYDTPAAAKDVPGPLQSLRLADGNWQGGSTLFGELGVKSWTAKLVDSGPARARVVSRYVLSDGTAASFTADLATSDNKLMWKVEISQNRPEFGVEFQLGKMPNVKQATVPKAWGQWGGARAIALTGGAEPFGSLSPNTSIANAFPDSPSTVILAPEGAAENGPQLRIASRRPGEWAEPKEEFTYAGYKKWDLDMIPLMWELWKRKRMPLTYNDGAASMKVNFAAGRRLWSVGNGAPVVGERLNEIKDWVLDWKSDTKHPNLFVSQADLEASWKQSTPDAEKARIYANAYGIVPGGAVRGWVMSGGDVELAKASTVPQLKKMLGELGDYDTMRAGIAVASLYDAMIDNPAVTPPDRALFRAQMAYLAYQMADPMMWSAERGYLSGNPDMSVSYILTLGVMAAAIPDHPMAKTWADYATRWLDHWLAVEVGPNGEWVPEGAHYGMVSAEPIFAYAIAAQRAGFHDFLADPRLKKLALYFAKQTTPPNPRRKNVRVSPPIGRGTSGDVNGGFGVLARATAESDPAFSATMQWVWQQMGYPVELSDWRLGGFEPVAQNRDLPAQQPEWKSELFPELGAVLRSGFGTTSEHNINILATVDSRRNLDVWAPEIGDIASWFAFGQPISKQFVFGIGYNDRHELASSGVMLARNYAPGDAITPFGYYTTTRPEGFSTAPNLDYVASTYTYTKPDPREWLPPALPAWPKVKAATEPKLTWKRQTMFLKDDQPDGANYLLLRDTVSGGQPTMWQFWTLSEKIGTPLQAKEVKAFLADKPGDVVVPASQLPAGDRYTALGNYGVDLEYFIASPQSTPRSTLRYGGIYPQTQKPEYQDLLHLQLPGDGAYFVALFPRPRAQAAPNFKTLADGKIIKVAGAFGTDYGFLSGASAKAVAEGVAFEGTAGALQIRKGFNVLSLASGGKVSYQEYSLAAPVAVSMRAEAKAVTVNIGSDAKSTLALGLPGKWKLETKGAELKSLGKGQYQVTSPANTRFLRLVAP